MQTRSDCETTGGETTVSALDIDIGDPSGMIDLYADAVFSLYYQGAFSGGSPRRHASTFVRRPSFSV